MAKSMGRWFWIYMPVVLLTGEQYDLGEMT